MKIAKSIEEADRGSYVILKATKQITKSDIENDPAWAMVAEEYLGCKDSEWLTKATVSILNSIIYQRRVVFILNRSCLRDLLKKDINWEPSLGLKNDRYSSIIRRICKGLVEKVGEVKVNNAGRYAMIFKVVHPEVLKYLQVDTNEQLKEAQNFSVKKPKPSKKDAYIWALAIQNNPQEWERAQLLENSEELKDYKEAQRIKEALFKQELEKIKGFENERKTQEIQ